jgi:hypothetical protein
MAARRPNVSPKRPPVERRMTAVPLEHGQQTGLPARLGYTTKPNTLLESHLMPTYRRFVVQTFAALLVIVVVAACRWLGPDLNIEIDNTNGPKQLTVTVDSSGPDMRGGDDVHVRAGEGAEWSVPLASTWEVKVDGKHVIGAGDRTDPALPPPDQQQDVTIVIYVTADGTVSLVDAH